MSRRSDGFLMRQVYTIALSGWDAGVTPGGGRQTITPTCHDKSKEGCHGIR